MLLSDENSVSLWTSRGFPRHANGSFLASTRISSVCKLKIAAGSWPRPGRDLLDGVLLFVCLCVCASAGGDRCPARTGQRPCHVALDSGCLGTSHACDCPGSSGADTGVHGGKVLRESFWGSRLSLPPGSSDLVGRSRAGGPSAVSLSGSGRLGRAESEAQGWGVRAPPVGCGGWLWVTLHPAALLRAGLRRFLLPDVTSSVLLIIII